MGKKKILKKDKKKQEITEEENDDNCWSTEIKQRRRFTLEEVQLLESIFERNHCPTQEDIQEIAYQLKTPRKNITTWFQNRRAKNKRKERETLWYAPFIPQPLFHPIKNTYYYYNTQPSMLYVNPLDLMLNQQPSTSSNNQQDVYDSFFDINLN